MKTTVPPTTPADRATSRRARPAPVRGALGRSLGKWLAISLVGVLASVVVVPRLLAGIPNPFASQRVERSSPALLQAVSDLHRYEAASASLEVVVDVEADAKYLPAAVKGERRILLAHGDVTAGVDLAGLGTPGAGTVVVDEARHAVTFRLPAATLGAVHLDMEHSRMLEHRRGALDRIGSVFGGAPGDNADLYALAERRLAAAAAESSVLALAQANTRTMLTRLANGLGYSDVTVTFDASEEAAAPSTSIDAPSASATTASGGTTPEP